jgi:hypothetical protein
MPWLEDLKIEQTQKNAELFDMGLINKQELNKRTNQNRKDKGRDNNKFKQEKLFDKGEKTDNKGEPLTVNSHSQET